MVKIDRKITSFRVKTENEKVLQEINTQKTIENPIPERDFVLPGKTYKIKPSILSESMYITITDFNGKPFEIFVNSKNVEHFEYISCITKLLSAIFRTCPDINFAIDELCDIQSPIKSYWGKNKRTGKGKYYKSILEEIGDVIKLHMENLTEEKGTTEIENIEDRSNSISESNLLLCPECKNKSAVLMDNCLTCTECGHSKCG